MRNLSATHHYIRCYCPQVLGKFPVIMADPPWDIHMELPYGTMSDDEMRRMDVQVRSCRDQTCDRTCALHMLTWLRVASSAVPQQHFVC